MKDIFGAAVALVMFLSLVATCIAISPKEGRPLTPSDIIWMQKMMRY